MKIKERIIRWYHSPEILKFYLSSDNGNILWGEKPFIDFSKCY